MWKLSLTINGNSWLMNSFGDVKPLNTLRPRQNGCHFADDIFKCIFLNENIWILIKISLKFVPNASINNIPALVQIMAWRHPGDKPLSEPMMVNLPTHICVIRPQWVRRSWAPFQYPIRCLIVRSQEVLKAWDWCLESSDHCGIWQAHWQQCCQDACQISKPCNDFNYQSCSFETSQDLMMRYLIGYWNWPLVSGARISNYVLHHSLQIIPRCIIDIKKK